MIETITKEIVRIIHDLEELITKVKVNADYDIYITSVLNNAVNTLTRHLAAELYHQRYLPTDITEDDE